MPRPPLVTVIVPAYNHEAYIEACLHSVLRQTHPAVELIVIDDGSSDGTPERIAALQAEHGFRFERQENRGLAATLNRGIELARGEYIATLGSDDLFTLDKLERQVALMADRPDVAVCGGNMLVIDQNGVILPRQKFFPDRELDFEDLFAQRKAGIPASSALIRRSVLEELGGYDPAIRLEDMYLWFKLLSHGYRMAGMNALLLYYRKHPTNTYRHYRFMYDNMMATFAPYREHPLYPDVVSRYRLSAALALAKHGEAAYARQVLRQVPLRYLSLKMLRGYFHAWKPWRHRPRPGKYG